MATDIVMPRLSDSMEEGTILRWLKSPGDQVSLGEELVEIETDKANMVYEAPAGGTLIETLAQEGDTLPIGQVIARVGEARGEAVRRRRRGETRARGRCGGGAAPKPAVEAAGPKPPAAPPAAGSATPSQRRRAGTGGSRPLRWRAGSRARRGSTWRRSRARGPGGRIVKADVERAIAAGPAPRRRLAAPRRRRPPPPSRPRERASARKRPREP